jgi:hypothetical protein
MYVVFLVVDIWVKQTKMEKTRARARDMTAKLRVVDTDSGAELVEGWKRWEIIS